jgi:hypothetical protein
MTRQNAIKKLEKAGFTVDKLSRRFQATSSATTKAIQFSCSCDWVDGIYVINKAETEESINYRNLSEMVNNITNAIKRAIA